MVPQSMRIRNSQRDQEDSEGPCDHKKSHAVHLPLVPIEPLNLGDEFFSAHGMMAERSC